MSSLRVVHQQQKSDMLWETKEALEQIKAIFAPKLTNLEFQMFVEMGKSTALNPFLKEIWAVKYGDNAAQIFIGRDGYRKSAQRSHAYDYHVADAIYSNDTFKVANGEVVHEYDLKDRGTLVGAYCVVQRKGSSRPSYVYVDVKEYNKNQSVWKEKPATMIKKVAEAQALKAAFQELFAGTYNEFEEFQPEKLINPAGKGVNGLKEKLGLVETEDEPEFNEIEVEEIHESHTASSIVFLIESATTKDELNEAISYAKMLPQDEKAPVREAYVKRKKELTK